DACLARVGLWPQRGKSVSAVAAGEVEWPQAGVKEVSDGNEHFVALEVAPPVVYLFEAVEVHHNHRERLARPGGPPPLRLKRFHEVAVRLQAGQTVCDGLLLGRLVGTSVVIRDGEIVG